MSQVNRHGQRICIIVINSAFLTQISLFIETVIEGLMIQRLTPGHPDSDIEVVIEARSLFQVCIEVDKTNHS